MLVHPDPDLLVTSTFSPFYLCIHTQVSATCASPSGLVRDSQNCKYPSGEVRGSYKHNPVSSEHRHSVRNKTSKYNSTCPHFDTHCFVSYSFPRSCTWLAGKIQVGFFWWGLCQSDPDPAFLLHLHEFPRVKFCQVKRLYCTPVSWENLFFLLPTPPASKHPPTPTPVACKLEPPLSCLLAHYDVIDSSPSSACLAPWVPPETGPQVMVHGLAFPQFFFYVSVPFFIIFFLFSREMWMGIHGK